MFLRRMKAKVDLKGCEFLYTFHDSQFNKEFYKASFAKKTIGVKNNETNMMVNMDVTERFCEYLSAIIGLCP